MQAAVERAHAERDEYKAMYSKEQARRKAVHNRLLELQGNIRVMCRCAAGPSPVGTCDVTAPPARPTRRSSMRLVASCKPSGAPRQAASDPRDGTRPRRRRGGGGGAVGGGRVCAQGRTHQDHVRGGLRPACLCPALPRPSALWRCGVSIHRQRRKVKRPSSTCCLTSTMLLLSPPVCNELRCNAVRPRLRPPLRAGNRLRRRAAAGGVRPRRVQRVRLRVRPDGVRQDLHDRGDGGRPRCVAARGGGAVSHRGRAVPGLVFHCHHVHARGMYAVRAPHNAHELSYAAS